MKAVNFCIFVVLLLASALSAQKTSDDSLRARAKSVLYEQPDETIHIALGLLQREQKPDEIAHLYMLISNAYIAKRNTDSSLYYILKATDLINTEALPTTKIKILSSVAVQYQQMELYDKALATLDRALQLTEQLKENDPERSFNLGFNNAVRGMIYRSQSNADLALEKFRTAAHHFSHSESSTKTAANLSIVYYNIGNCFIDLGKYAQAGHYFGLARKYALASDAASLHAYALKGTAEMLFLQHQYDKALPLLLQAEKLAAPIGDVILNEGIYRLLANSHLALNQFKEYQHYNDRFLETQKTLEQNEVRSLNRYLNTQATEEMQRQEATARRFVWYRWISAGIVLLLILLLARAYHSTRIKNRRLRNVMERLTRPGGIS